MILCLISMNIAFNGYRRLNMELTNAETWAFLNVSSLEDESAWETLSGMNKVFKACPQTRQTEEEWFRRLRAVEKDTLNMPNSGEHEMTTTKPVMEHIELIRHVASQNLTETMRAHLQTNWRHLEKPGYKNNWYLRVSRFDANNFWTDCVPVISHWHGASLIISETDGDRGGNITHIQKYQARPFVVKGQWIIPKSAQAGINGQKRFINSFVRLEEIHPPRAPFIWLEDYF